MAGLVRKLLKVGFIAILALCLGVSMLPPRPASALTGSDFSAGNIISGAVFTNSTSMSASNIQDFLSSKVPTCSTNHTGFTGSTGTVYNPPFVCLKDFYENPNSTYTVSFSYTDTSGNPQTGSRTYYNNNAYKVTALCPVYGGYSGTPTCGSGDYHNGLDHLIPTLQTSGLSTPSGAESAAQIIYNAAQQYSINPQVLIVTLQKEQGLVTDDWPASYEYQEAMGYGCPDTAPCSSNYAGFSNQVIGAAWQFRQYLTNPNNYNYVVGNDYIQYNPSSSCGGSTVNIQNQATAALYDYTPYQPNSNVLANTNPTGSSSGPGSDVSCGAYGNRNFWWYFTTWFGSTQTTIPYAWTLSKQSMYADAQHTQPFSNSAVNIAPGAKAYLEVQARNNGNQTWSQSVVHLGTSNPDDRSSIFSDSSWLSSTRIQMQQSSVAPGDVATFDFSITAPQTYGIYNEYFNLVADGITWMNDPGMFYTINVVKQQTAVRSTNYQLSSNQTLAPGNYLMSSEGGSTLQLSSSGALQLRSDGQQTWSNGVSGANPQLLAMQSDGNLVEYAKSGTVLWNSGTSGNPGAFLVLQADGNLVIYSSSGTALWASGTSNVPTYDMVAFYALPTGLLLPGQGMSTPDGTYHLELQTDGNLVLYDVSKPLWASGTAGRQIANLSMQPDGNLVLYTANGQAVWNSGTYGNPGDFLAVQQDGNVVLYTSRGAIWNTNTRQ